jgi:hypothetical protein
MAKRLFGLMTRTPPVTYDVGCILKTTHEVSFAESRL